MIKYIDNCIKKMEAVIGNSSQKTEIVFIEDEKGIGKSTFIETYFKNKNNTVFFKSGINNITLNSIYQQMLNFGLTNQYDERIIKIPFPSFLIQKLLEFSLYDYKCICFDGVELYDNETINFFLDYLSNVINKKCENNGCIIIFVLIDGMLNSKTKGFINNFGHYIQYFKMPSWTLNDFEDFLNINYNKIKISTESIEMLSKYSFGNISAFLKAIDYLKIKNIFYKKDDYWKCDLFPESILLSSFQTNISERFDLLDDSLKTVLKKASIVGLEFSFSDLEKPLQVQLANKALNEIESISRLIDEKVDNYNIFQFKSIETQTSIESFVEPENVLVWSNLLGDHYISEIDNSYKINVLSLCERLLRATLYYKKGERIEISLSCCLHLISLLTSQFRFYQALDIIKITDSFGISDSNIKANLLKYKYICSVGVFDFDEANIAINKYALIIKPQKFDEIHINALRAYSLYNKGLTRKAYSLARINYDKLRNLLNSEGGEKEEVLSLFEKKAVLDSIAILAALEQTLGIPESFGHFNDAIKITEKYKLTHEYYSLLRRCTLAYNVNVVNLLNQAKEYFVNRNQIEYAMTCYNLSTEYVYLNMPNEASENIKIADEIFSLINHAGIVCVQIERATLISIYYKQYNLALDIMKKRCKQYDEDFVELVFYYNLSTIYRKLGIIDKSWEYINKTEQINNINENKLPYFEKLILAQKGYLKLLEEDLKNAKSYFEEFIRHSYNIRDEITLSVAYTLNNMDIAVSEDIKKMAVCENPIVKTLSENKLIFAELSFYEL